jgi:hypothetical protein
MDVTQGLQPDVNVFTLLLAGLIQGGLQRWYIHTGRSSR